MATLFAMGFGSEEQNSEFSSPPSQLTSYFRANSFQHKPDHCEKTPKLVLFSWVCCLQWSACNPGIRDKLGLYSKFEGPFQPNEWHKITTPPVISKLCNKQHEFVWLSTISSQNSKIIEIFNILGILSQSFPVCSLFFFTTATYAHKPLLSVQIQWDADILERKSSS